MLDLTQLLNGIQELPHVVLKEPYRSDAPFMQLLETDRTLIATIIVIRRTIIGFGSWYPGASRCTER